MSQKQYDIELHAYKSLYINLFEEHLNDLIWGTPCMAQSIMDFDNLTINQLIGLYVCVRLNYRLTSWTIILVEIDHTNYVFGKLSLDLFKISN